MCGVQLQGLQVQGLLRQPQVGGHKGKPLGMKGIGRISEVSF